MACPRGPYLESNLRMNRVCRGVIASCNVFWPLRPRSSERQHEGKGTCCFQLYPESNLLTRRTDERPDGSPGWVYHCCGGTGRIHALRVELKIGGAIPLLQPQQ